MKVNSITRNCPVCGHDIEVPIAVAEIVKKADEYHLVATAETRGLVAHLDTHVQKTSHLPACEENLPSESAREP